MKHDRSLRNIIATYGIWSQLRAHDHTPLIAYDRHLWNNIATYWTWSQLTVHHTNLGYTWSPLTAQDRNLRPMIPIYSMCNVVIMRPRMRSCYVSCDHGPCVSIMCHKFESCPLSWNHVQVWWCSINCDHVPYVSIMYRKLWSCPVHCDHVLYNFIMYCKLRSCSVSCEHVS